MATSYEVNINFEGKDQTSSQKSHPFPDYFIFLTQKLLMNPWKL